MRRPRQVTNEKTFSDRGVATLLSDRVHPSRGVSSWSSPRPTSYGALYEAISPRRGSRYHPLARSLRHQPRVHNDASNFCEKGGLHRRPPLHSAMAFVQSLTVPGATPDIFHDVRDTARDSRKML